ncbi:MAG: aldehyde dehydrogenase family protein [Acidobacteriota bacterium]
MPTLKVINPYNQQIAGELAYDDPAGLEAKVAAAVLAFHKWRQAPLEDRKRHVQGAIDRFREDANEIAREITCQMGKPIAQAEREVETCCQRAEYMLSIVSSTLAPEILPSDQHFHLRIEHAPLGVVLDLAAWNYPLLIPVNVIVPALLAGNSVLLKHSAKTPVCGRRFHRAFQHPELPGLISDLILQHDTVAQLIADPRIAYVAFTGSVQGGHAVYRQTSHRFVEAGLELGGKDPAYVAEDADLAFAVENVIDGACYNAGQSCCAVERVYVHHRLYDEFLGRAHEVLKRYRMGDPLEPATTLGPLASRSALDLLEGQVQDAMSRGARLLLGGRRLPETKGNFFPPTLLADVPNDTEIMQEESFGPVVPVQAVRNDQEALARMNDTRYGLTASVWTQDRHKAEWFAQRLEAGTIFQNRCDYLEPSLPWTGVRDSGKGSTLSKYGFYHLTRRKAVHFRLDTA